MQTKNTNTQYGIVSKSFHWLTAFLVLGMLVLGFYMGGMASGPEKAATYGLHKSIGAVILILTALRIIWHATTPPPRALESLKTWEKLAAASVHKTLYVLLLAMPLSGVLMSNAFGRPVSVFGLFNMPTLIGENRELGGKIAEAHEFIAFALIAVIAMHILAAFKHAVINKDGVLRRMF